MTAADRIGIPVLLLSGLWGVFEVALRAFEQLNKARDSFLAAQRGVESAGPTPASTVFLNDWLPLWIGTVAFMALFTYVMIRIPEFLGGNAPEIKRKVKHICWIAAVLPAIGFLGFLLGGIGDIFQYVSAS